MPFVCLLCDFNKKVQCLQLIEYCNSLNVGSNWIIIKGTTNEFWGKNMKNVSRTLGMFLFLFSAALLTCSCGKKDKNSQPSSNKESNGDFTILSFTPDGELPATVKFPSIQVQFSEPVVALTKLGKPSDKSDIVTIEPALKGTFRWFGTSLLSFECSESVIPQKEYKVTVSDKTTSVGGKKITGTLTYSFHSEELTLLSIVPGYDEVKKGNYVDTDDLPVELARDIALYFNTNVNVKVIEKEVIVSGTAGDKFDFTATKETDNIVRLKLKKAPPADTDITVELTKGSMADENCYAISEAQRLSFHTLRPFAIQECNYDPQYLDSSFTNPVQLTLNHQMKQGTEAEVAKHISTKPAMKITAANISLNGKTIVVHSLPVNFSSVYDLNIDKDLADAYGLKLAAAASYEITVPDAASFVYFKDWGFKMLESQFAPKLA